MALVLRYTACSETWVARCLADRLRLQGRSQKLTINCINTDKLIHAMVVEKTPISKKYQDFDSFISYQFEEKCKRRFRLTKRSPFAVVLPVAWVLNGPLSLSSYSISTSFKANIEHGNELATQLKSFSDIELFWANNQIDQRPAADSRAHKNFQKMTVHNGLRNNVRKLWSTDNT